MRRSITTMEKASTSILAQIIREREEIKESKITVLNKKIILRTKK